MRHASKADSSLMCCLSNVYVLKFLRGNKKISVVVYPGFYHTHTHTHTNKNFKRGTLTFRKTRNDDNDMKLIKHDSVNLLAVVS